MNIRVMLVDDSTFSRTILAGTLEEVGCEIVGEADSIESLIQTYQECRPDIVIMDIAMPGADGFECTKALRMHDPATKVIMCSSMKDEESEAEAKRAGAVGYVQKPADVETLQRVIQHVLAPDSLFGNLEEWGLDAFKEALAQSTTRMTKTTVSFRNIDGERQHTSQGIMVVIGIIGRYPGSLIIDISNETAEKMAASILKREAKNRDEVVSMAAEYANVVGGIACSMLNKKDKSFGFKVAPPSVFLGEATEMFSPNIRLRSVYADTDFGQIYMSLGFKKGLVLWM